MGLGPASDVVVGGGSSGSVETVAQAVGRALVEVGVDHVFGVVGSGNFHVTNAMVAAGATFVAARHEGGAVTMADAYARITGRPTAVTVHQGCGLTNTMTGLTEAAKSRTPVIVLAAEVSQPRSNFFVDQPALAAAVGAESRRLDSPETAVADACAAVATGLHGRRTVLLNLPLHLQDDPSPGGQPRAFRIPAPPTAPDGDALARLQDLLNRSQRPVFLAGRGSRGTGCRAALEALAERHGALLATSAVAKGLFHDSPWSLDVSGGFASPLAAELIGRADLIVGWGCSLNMWTMRHGTLIGPDAVVVQVDDDEAAIGLHREVSLGVVGDVRRAAEALLAQTRSTRPGWRSDELADRIACEVRWRDVPYHDESTPERVDPRTLTIALDDLLPTERVLSIDSGNFMGYPSMFLSVPDEVGFCFTQAYQSIGLGLATGIGAALARPDRLPVVATGDGGLMMAAAEAFDTVRRLGLPMAVVVYNDDAYGAEVHHFARGGHPLDIVRFPPTDIAAIARGYGFEAVTVRVVDDLALVADWVARWRPGSAVGGLQPLLIDAKVVSDTGSWWLQEAFRGH